MLDGPLGTAQLTKHEIPGMGCFGELCVILRCSFFFSRMFSQKSPSACIHSAALTSSPTPPCPGPGCLGGFSLGLGLPVLDALLPMYVEFSSHESPNTEAAHPCDC